MGTTSPRLQTFKNFIIFSFFYRKIQKLGGARPPSPPQCTVLPLPLVYSLQKNFSTDRLFSWLNRILYNLADELQWIWLTEFYTLSMSITSLIRYSGANLVSFVFMSLHGGSSLLKGRTDSTTSRPMRLSLRDVTDATRLPMRGRQRGRCLKT